MHAEHSPQMCGQTRTHHLGSHQRHSRSRSRSRSTAGRWRQRGTLHGEAASGVAAAVKRRAFGSLAGHKLLTAYLESAS